MKIETILDAHEEICRRGGIDSYLGNFDMRLQRQYFAFRDRILKMFAEKDDLIESLLADQQEDFAIVKDLERALEVQANRIAELEADNRKLNDKVFYLQREISELEYKIEYGD